MRRTLTALSTLFALGATAQSQSGLWLGADASYDINRRLATEIELGTRLEDDFNRFTRYDAAIGFDYKALPWLKVGAGYDFIRDYNAGETEVLYRLGPDNKPDLDSDGNRIVKGVNIDEPAWRTKHRLYVDLTEKCRFGRFTFSLRERYQYTRITPTEVYEWRFRDEYDADEYSSFITRYPDQGQFFGPLVGDDGEDYYYRLGKDGFDTKKAKDRHYLRTRLAVNYNIRRCPLTPFASYELANDLGDAFSIVRHRVTAGFDLNLTRNKQHALSLAYLYQNGAQEEAGQADMHIITLGYKFSFESARVAAQKAAKKKAKKQNQK